jgi:hypothetical protein
MYAGQIGDIDAFFGDAAAELSREKAPRLGHDHGKQVNALQDFESAESRGKGHLKKRPSILCGGGLKNIACPVSASREAPF